ncbi:hypothetical protein SAMN05216249_10351 [Acetitomaculum ruminis DSM 5522]|uniref:FtsX-like permease family protein n=1 Tax=Acetitomaculum ruminis DSM 5522 TaxID=1120918 RepID=A0A1I0W4G7_9FIRM|nr:ABC transporter permease [Acetitomaculum ruminis]SFA83110.1 hypothetical protein SAMN05216249_10351 [Acetitomaculum ruminis DSM 5522]
MKKIISILLAALVCILPIMCILMVHHITLCNTMQQMEEGIFGKNSYLFLMSKNIRSSRKELMNAIKKQNVAAAVYLDDTNDSSYTIRYMAYNKSYITLPMVKGRFFYENEFKEGNNLAVVGKNIKNIYEKSGERYIKVDDHEYKVIGIVGYEEDTAFDNYIILNLLSGERDDLSIYTLDVFQEDEDAYLLTHCKKALKNKDCEIEILSESEQFIDTLKIDFNTVSYFFALLLSYILCVIVISYQWVIIQRKEIGIKRLLGASKKGTVFSILGRYLMYMALSLWVGLIYCYFFYPSYMVSFSKGYLITGIVLLLFMILMIIRIKNDSIEEAIKL